MKISLAYYKKTYYLRDAQGNIMATYNRTYAGESPQDLTMSFSLVERPIYGSSRIANFVDSVQLVYLEAGETEFSYPDDIDLLEQNNGTKHFELTNHLGNVMAVVTDKRLPILTGTYPDEYIATFQPELLIAKDYYPFGMEMSGRYDLSNPEPLDVGYRFGFNGMEKDDEITGYTDRGNHYTAAFWEYDSRIGRRWNIDPVDKANESSYLAFSGNPIIFIDPNGDNANPIFSLNGKLLGFDERGMAGEAIIMDVETYYSLKKQAGIFHSISQKQAEANGKYYSTLNSQERHYFMQDGYGKMKEIENKVGQVEAQREAMIAVEPMNNPPFGIKGPKTQSVSYGGALGLGYEAELGIITDDNGLKRFYFSHGPLIGFRAVGPSVNQSEIIPQGGNTFNASDYQGEASEFNVSFDAYSRIWGGDVAPLSVPKNKFTTDIKGKNYSEKTEGLGNGLGTLSGSITLGKKYTTVFDD